MFFVPSLAQVSAALNKARVVAILALLSPLYSVFAVSFTPYLNIGGGISQTPSSGTELAAQELLKNHDYCVVFNMLGMELARDTVLQKIPATPEGYELRAAKPEHHLMIWQSIGDAYDARNRENKRFGEAVRKERYRSYFSGDPSLIFVAWELQSERIAGQVLYAILDNGGAEVLEVSVGLGHQRKGLGRFLLLNALHELRSRGVELITLGTRAENPTEAWRLYEEVGFRASKDFLRWRKKRD